MCFRPAQVTMKTCPACGAVNKPIAKVCEKCGAELDNKKIDFDADQSKLDAANTTGSLAPAAPAAPAPAAPGAPKPPQG